MMISCGGCLVLSKTVMAGILPFIISRESKNNKKTQFNGDDRKKTKTLAQSNFVIGTQKLKFWITLLRFLSLHLETAQGSLSISHSLAVSPSREKLPIGGQINVKRGSIFWFSLFCKNGSVGVRSRWPWEVAVPPRDPFNQIVNYFFDWPLHI